MKKYYWAFICWIFLTTKVFAQETPLFDPIKLKSFSLQEVINNVHNGQVIILSETHDSLKDHENQKKFVRALIESAQVAPLSVAMEFFDYTKQALVDEYLESKLSESEFLKKMKWGSFDFGFYRDLVWAPPETGGRTYAINIPMSITNHIRFQGIEYLSEDELSKLPPHFEIGSDLYKKRFVEYLQIVHPETPEEMWGNMFTAQSAWDDTMAWKISEAMAENPNQVLIVIVGNFHAEFGLGLPARLKVRGVSDILTVTQFNSPGKTYGDLLKYTFSPEYGLISDLVWIQ